MNVICYTCTCIINLLIYICIYSIYILVLYIFKFINNEHDSLPSLTWRSAQWCRLHSIVLSTTSYTLRSGKAKFKVFHIKIWKSERVIEVCRLVLCRGLVSSFAGVGSTPRFSTAPADEKSKSFTARHHTHTGRQIVKEAAATEPERS